jgi:hypothetical protein
MKGKEKIRSKLSETFLVIKSFGSFFLSHHPECESFKGHAIKLGKYEFCIGCFIGYPTSFISIIILGVFKLTESIPSNYLIIFGILFMLTFFLSLTGATKIKVIKIIQKIFIGFGSALIYWGIFSLDFSDSTNFIIFILVFSTIITFLNTYHAYGLYKTCKKCEFQFKWGQCSGFEAIRNKLKKYDLPDLIVDIEFRSKSRKEN